VGHTRFVYLARRGRVRVVGAVTRVVGAKRSTLRAYLRLGQLH